MYRDLRRDIDKGDIKKLGVVSWTRMTRKEEGMYVPETVYELRPQCARSTVGQHDHNDIFIMEGEMFAVKGKWFFYNYKYYELNEYLVFIVVCRKVHNCGALLYHRHGHSKL